jgi:hypothetical protein
MGRLYILDLWDSMDGIARVLYDIAKPKEAMDMSLVSFAVV